MPRRLLAAVLWLALAVPAAADDRVVTRVAFGSCADQDKPCPIWDAVAAARPDVLVLLGDTVYADLDKSKKVTAELIRSKYDTLDRVEPFKKLKAAVPLLATWDDHDYGKNDADATWPLKDESQRVFLDFLGVPADSPRRTRKGVYHAEVFGPPGKRVQVIVLDGRYHRSPIQKDKFDPKARVTPYIPNTDPAATFLGEEQWKWLEEQLKQPAELRLLGSGIQVLAEDHPHERWALIPHERERLFKLLKDTQANGVVILSGDRHLAELSVATGLIGYPLYDVTASGLNQATLSWRPPEKNRHRVAAVPYENHFGLVTVDWASPASPRVSLQIRDEDGEILVRHNLRLGMLKPNPQAAAGGTSALPLPEGALTPAEAAKKVGEEVTVQFDVQSARRTTGDSARLFLNSKANFRDEDNFTVMLTGKALEGIYKDATGDTFKGKTVRAKGKVQLYQNRPEVIIEDEKQLEVVGK
jgi:alkaline phosphatase D